MGGEGHMLDMIRRLSEGREASRLRRERNNEKLKHLNRNITRCPIPRRKKWNVSSVIPRRKRNGTTATSYGGH